ncbi:MAG: hypothetical protein FH753_14115 [Firmicutes bacterium]|nr:hypothetical protein [Bacillota bacterium]
MESEAAERGIEFISDENINLDDQDQLGTKIYSKSLYDIIIKYDNSKPMTIGLYGSWGSGKSSIVKTVKEKLNTEFNNNDKKIGVMTYDAWKYSNDAFRRSFILELKKAFHLEMSEELETFYQDTHEEVDHRVEVKTKGLLISGFLVLIPLATIISYFLFNSSSVIDKIAIGLFGIYLSGITYFLKQSLYEYKISVTKPKMFSPEQFENAFINAINTLTGKKTSINKWFKNIINKEVKYDKIVIIVDNIDRCHSELSKELLLTIKNFLEVKDCIFIIPVDNEALKNHLDFDYNYQGEEFLRKFFNITVRIKKFTPRNLLGFTRGLIEDKDFGFSSKVADIVSQEFSKNPRRIIQFLNNLYAEKLVAEAQEKNGEVPKGAITDNLEFLAKVLLIREEWPNLYNILNTKPRLLKLINKKIINNQYDKQNYLLEDLDGIKKITMTKEQILFLKRTLNISVENIEPFFRLRDTRKGIPHEIVDSILRQDLQSIKGYLKGDNIDFKTIMNILYEELDNVIKWESLYETRGFSLLNLLFEIMYDEDYKQSFEDEYYKFNKILKNSKIINLIPKFNSDALLNYAYMLSQKGKNYLRDYIIKSIENSEEKEISFIYKYIDCYTLDINSLSEINHIVYIMIKENEININELKNLIINSEVANALINEDTINTIIELIDKDPKEENKDFINFLRKMNDFKILDISNKFKYINKISEFISDSNYNIHQFWMKAMLGFLDEFTNETENDRLYKLLTSRHSTSWNQLNKNKNNKTYIESNRLILNLFKEYYLYVEDKQNAIDIIIKYLNSNQNQQVYLEANNCIKEIVDYFEVHDWSFSQDIINMVNALGNHNHKIEFLNTISMMLDKTEKSGEGYIGLTDSQIQSTINIIFKLYFNNANQSEKYKEILIDIFGMTNITNKVKAKLISISNIKHQKDILKLVELNNYEDITKVLITKMIGNANNYKDMDDRIKFIKDNVSKWNIYVKGAILEILVNFNIDEPLYYLILDICIDYDIDFYKSEFISILDKVEMLLSSNNDKIKEKGIDILQRVASLPKRKEYKETKRLIVEYLD